MLHSSSDNLWPISLPAKSQQPADRLERFELCPGAGDPNRNGWSWLPSAQSAASMQSNRLGHVYLLTSADTRIGWLDIGSGADGNYRLSCIVSGSLARGGKDRVNFINSAGCLFAYATLIFLPGRTERHMLTRQDGKLASLTASLWA